MKKTNIKKSFQVIYEKFASCPLDDLRMNFFQFIYTVSGKGEYIINGNSLSFVTGDLFLITPNESHEFNLAEECEFLIIRFQKNFIKEYSSTSIDHIKCLLYNSSNLLGTIVKNDKDRNFVNTLIEGILQIYEEDNVYAEDMMRNLINSIIVITARNLSVIRPLDIDCNSDNKIVDIIDYIQNYIYDPVQLKAAVIAEKFGISEKYLGTFFKRQSGETLQGFIASYRVRLIEHKLKFSDSRIHEIVEEFGFSDESHINKFFKKHKGETLSSYRSNFQLQQIVTI